MNISFNKIITKLRSEYATSNTNPANHSGLEIKFIESMLLAEVGGNSLSHTSAERITEAVILAAKMGVSLNPSLRLARLRTFTENDGQHAWVLDLSLNGMLDALNRVEGMCIDKLCVIHQNEKVSWSGDVMHSAISPVLTPGNPEEAYGALCVIRLACGDLLPTTISHQEIEELADLLGIDNKQIPSDFSKYHVLKRALKCLLPPVNSQLSLLLQVTHLSDRNLFRSSDNDERGKAFFSSDPGCTMPPSTRNEFLF